MEWQTARVLGCLSLETLISLQNRITGGRMNCRRIQRMLGIKSLKLWILPVNCRRNVPLAVNQLWVQVRKMQSKRQKQTSVGFLRSLMHHFLSRRRNLSSSLSVIGLNWVGGSSVQPPGIPRCSCCPSSILFNCQRYCTCCPFQFLGSEFQTHAPSR